LEGIYLITGLIVAIMVVLFLWMDRRWKKLFDEQKTDPSSQAMWSFIQQQIEQLRGQMNDGLNKNILQLTEQQRTVNEQLRGITDQVNRQLQTSSEEINKRLDNAARVIGDVQKNIGELSEASRQIFEVGKNITTLQEILQPPKLRGGLGELFLGELLSQTLPSQFFTLQ
jgi:DNA anti-recombination protein RmuC